MKRISRYSSAEDFLFLLRRGFSVPRLWTIFCSSSLEHFPFLFYGGFCVSLLWRTFSSSVESPFPLLWSLLFLFCGVFFSSFVESYFPLLWSLLFLFCGVLFSSFVESSFPLLWSLIFLFCGVFFSSSVESFIPLLWSLLFLFCGVFYSSSFFSYYMSFPVLLCEGFLFPSCKSFLECTKLEELARLFKLSISKRASGIRAIGLWQQKRNVTMRQIYLRIDCKENNAYFRLLAKI